MSIHYNDDVATIYCGKFQDLLPTLTFNFVLTDPPYNVDYKYPDYKDKLSEEEYVKMIGLLKKYPTAMIHYAEAFCGVLHDAMGRPNRCVSWCYSSNLPRQSRMIAFYNCMPDFEKVKQPYKNPNDKRIQALIAKGSQGSRLYDWWSDIQLVKNVSKDKVASFSNQMPIELLERILLLTTKEGDTILDPFFGSGSLYFACKKTNRKCIGIEQSKVHLKAFDERLKQSRETP
jgi:site-specific DNA-methyltransferase (adenine-specific)